MILDRLELRDFRSFEEADFTFSEEINVISGPNGVGKTNLLEAVFYLSCVKSLRGAREAELSRFGTEQSTVKARVRSGGRERELHALLRRGQKRLLWRDAIDTKPKDWLGLLPSVLFCPSDLSLLLGGPAERLRFLDMALCQMKPRYTEALSRYRSLFQAKQKLLHKAAEAPSFLEVLDDYNLRMAQTGAILHGYRETLIGGLERFAGERHQAVSGGREHLCLRYRSQAGDAEACYHAMCAKREAELAAGRSLCGAHRDELEVWLNRRPIRAYGSQGQIRSAVIALKLGLRDLLCGTFGEAPLLLLDDVLSELDEGRQRYILNSLDGGQVFITSCEPGRFSRAGHNILLTPKESPAAGLHTDGNTL